jgi:hypothetical protein
MEMRFVAMLLLASCGLAAADRDFDRVVAEIESRYGVKRTHIPMMGVANLVAKFAKPAGTSGFKIAIFENLDSSRRYGDGAGLDRFFDGLSGGELHPMIRVHSRQSGESTYIATGEAGKSTRVLIVTVGRNEATVVEVKVDPEVLQKMLASPEHADKMFGMHADSDHD